MKNVKTKYYTVFNFENYGKGGNMILRRGELLIVVKETQEYYIVKRPGRGNHRNFLITKDKVEEIK